MHTDVIEIKLAYKRDGLGGDIVCNQIIEMLISMMTFKSSLWVLNVNNLLSVFFMTVHRTLFKKYSLIF